MVFLNNNLILKTALYPSYPRCILETQPSPNLHNNYVLTHARKKRFKLQHCVQKEYGISTLVLQLSVKEVELFISFTCPASRTSFCRRRQWFYGLQKIRLSFVKYWIDVCFCYTRIYNEFPKNTTCCLHDRFNWIT